MELSVLLVLWLAENVTEEELPVHVAVFSVHVLGGGSRECHRLGAPSSKTDDDLRDGAVAGRHRQCGTIYHLHVCILIAGPIPREFKFDVSNSRGS